MPLGRDCPKHALIFSHGEFIIHGQQGHKEEPEFLDGDQEGSGVQSGRGCDGRPSSVAIQQSDNHTELHFFHSA